MNRGRNPIKAICFVLVIFLLLFSLSGCLSEEATVSYNSTYWPIPLNKNTIKSAFDEDDNITITKIHEEEDSDYDRVYEKQILEFKFSIKSTNSSREYDHYIGTFTNHYNNPHREKKNFTSVNIQLDEEQYPDYPPSTVEKAKKYKPAVRRGGVYIEEVIYEAHKRNPYDSSIDVYGED